MKSRRIADGYLVRLERGEEVIAALTLFAADKKIPCGFLEGIGAVREVVMAGERMPQKSTNFFPKLYSGLVFNRLDG